ncbi:MAG TPA: hypothetical protein VEK76_13160 [Candidatus Binatia bacterium]|nr:hypothetical protein [Candidatus Binatia bacterium]
MIGALKGLAGSALAAAVAFSGVYALAAQLGGSVPSLGAAAVPISSACTQDTLNIGYSVAYSASVGIGGGYAVTNVTVTDGAARPNLAPCVGEKYQVTLRAASGADLGTLGGTVPADQSSFAPPTGFAEPVDASSVASVALVIGI